MHESDDHRDTSSVESDSSSSYESYSNRDCINNARLSPIPHAVKHDSASKGLAALSATSDWMNDDLESYDKHFVIGNRGITNSHPYLDDETSGNRDEFYDELYLGAPQVDSMVSESIQEMLDHSSASSGYLQDEQSPKIPGDSSSTRKLGRILRPMSRAERQRCKRRSYQIAFVTTLLLIILSVTLCITLGRENQSQAETSQPVTTTNPQSNTSGSQSQSNTTAPNTTTTVSDNESSGQSEQVDIAQQLVNDALASTSRNATQRPIRVR